MATNANQESGTIKITAAGALTSGDPHVIGPSGEEVVTILMESAVSGDTIGAWTRGVFTVTKETTNDLVQGEKVYYDTSASNFTTVATGNVYAGRAHTAASSTASSFDLDLNAV